MQTTLLGLGIAIILALVAALVGPLFIDWGQYRGTIEAEAARVLGVPVRVTGPIDVRLLPAPSLSLNGVELGPPRSEQTLAARRLAMEFGLGTLMRGEFRANQVTIDGLDLTVGLDRFGNVEMPAASLGFDPDRLAIDRLTIENGRIGFKDAASGARVAIDDVKLTGEVRSLLGPFKAEGAFAADGERYGYRLSGSRRGDDGGMKLRLAVDPPAERALAFESEGTLWVEAGSPRYEGAVTLSRVVGTALPGGQVAINDPWRITGKLKATTASALVRELDLQYGPDVRTVRLTGSAIMDFGRDPRIAAELTARQVDLDRALGASEQKRLPFEAIKSIAEGLATWAPPRLPIGIDLGVDSLTVGGATLTAVRSRIENTSGGWNIGTLELRAPGATLIGVGGKLAVAERKVEFKGPVKFDSSDPAVFFAWVEGRSAAGRPALGPMRGGGTVTLGSERIAVDELRAEIDRKPLEGRLSYRFATPAMPARLDAALGAADLDLDRTLSVGTALFASTSFGRPGEVALAVDIARATYAGVEARGTHAVLAYDSSGLKIERLSIADIGGASLDASGRVDNAADAARGSIALSLAAPRLDAIAMLAEKFLPQSTETIRKYGGRIAPLRVNAKLDFEPRPGNAAGGRTAAKLKLDGRLAGIEVNLAASGTGDIADPAAADLQLDGRLDAAEARTLASFIGLDAFVNADARPARLTLLMNGAADRSFRVDGKFSGTDVDASAAGTLTPSGNGTLDVSLRAADSRLPRRGPSGAVPVDLRGHVAIDGSAVALSDLAGRIAGANVKGRLAFGLGQPLQVNGRIEADQVDAAELIALFTGMPRARGQAVEWPTEPFVQTTVPAMDGRVEFRAATARWAAGLVTRDLAGAARFEPTGLSLADVTGTLADGRLELDAQMRRDPMGISLKSHVKLTNADLPVLLAGVLRVPAVGRISLETEVQGQGLSAASLVGALKGSGTVTAEHVEIAGLNPTAIDAVIGALERDRGLGANPARVAEIAAAGLDAGRLGMPFAVAPIMIADGRAQVISFSALVQNADLAGSVSLGLIDGQIDARLAMTGAQRNNAPAPGDRPVMAVAVRGPLASARRTVDIASLVGWVTMQRVDREAKRLDDAEKEHQRLEAATEALRRQPDASKTPAEPGSAAPPVSAQASTVGRAPDPPATTDIKPVTPPRRAPPPPPLPPAPRSLMQELFGR